jgi:hypothetical protein
MGKNGIHRAFSFSMANIPYTRIGLCVLWLFLVGAGTAMILNYQNSSGGVDATPEHWPSGTHITLDPDRDTLILFAHPQCPCTRASLEELNRLLAQSHGQIAAHVLFLKPEQFPDTWMQTDLRRSAAAIPGVTVQDDINGETAKKFGAETSGYVLLYDTRGQLLFKGGITSSRGQAGDNAGEEKIIALASGLKMNFGQTPVYGCSLLNKFCLQKGIAK